MKTRIVILIAFIMLFTGCGAQAGEGADSSFSPEEQREDECPFAP